MKKTVPRGRQHLAGGKLRLGERFAEAAGDAHHFAGRLHLRTKKRVDAGEFRPRKYRRFDVVVRAGSEVFAAGDLIGQQFAKGAARHQARCNFSERHAGGFGNIRHSARGARIDLDDIDMVFALLVALNGELQVDEADDFESQSQLARVSAERFKRRLGDVDSGQHAGGVAGVDAGLFNVLHDAGDEDIFRVAERVDVDLDGVLKEVIDQNRPLLRVFNRLAHVARDGVGVVGNDHGPSAEHVAGTNQNGIADSFANGQRLLPRWWLFRRAAAECSNLRAACQTACGLPQGQSIQETCR